MSPLSLSQASFYFYGSLPINHGNPILMRRQLPSGVSRRFDNLDPMRARFSRFTNFGRSALVAAATLLFIGALQYAVAPWYVKPTMVDFGVLYCGERVASAHADPYRTEPLRTCEHAGAHDTALAPTWQVTPFALPGYAIALFAPLGVLPFGAASLCWLGTLVAGFSVAAVAVARIARVRTVLAAAVFAPTIGFLNFTLGEPVDVSIGCVALAALALERGMARAAAIAAAFAMVEPHVGLPACLALFALRPATRLPLVSAAVLFFGLSVAAVGTNDTIEYVSTFLPLHAHAELYAADQYSLSHVLFLAGVAPNTAIALGGLEYVIAIGFGIAGAARLVSRGAPEALLVLLPVAVAMLGGSFIHSVEIAAALPAALVLAPRSVLARIAVTLLAVPWSPGTRGLIVLVAAAAIAVACISVPKGFVMRRVRFAAAATLVVLAANVVLPVTTLSEKNIRANPPVTIAGDTPSSVAWEWGTRLKPAWSDTRPRSLLLKLPTWLALILLTFTALSALTKTSKSNKERAPHLREAPTS